MPLFTLDKLLDEDATVEYLVYPFLTLYGTLLLAAPNKSMKTFWGLNLATALASGKPFAGVPTKKSRTLYIDFEIGVAEAKKRAGPMAAHYGRNADLYIRTSDEQPLSLDIGTNGHINFENLLGAVGPEVVFIDALRFATQHDENSSNDMARVMGEIRRLKLKYHFTVVLIHHMGKEPSEMQTGPRTSRGSSVIEDSPDSIGYLNRFVTDEAADPRISIKWKLRNHSPVAPMNYTFDQGSGLFIPTPHKTKAAKKEVKHEPITEIAASEGIDISDGLLSAVREEALQD